MYKTRKSWKSVLGLTYTFAKWIEGFLPNFWENFSFWRPNNVPILFLCQKCAVFVVQILFWWWIFQKGNFIKAGSADCRKPCSERSERCPPRDRRDAFVHVKRLDLLHLLNVFVASVCLWGETSYSLNLPYSRFRRREPHRQHANWATFCLVWIQQNHWLCLLWCVPINWKNWACLER